MIRTILVGLVLGLISAPVVGTGEEATSANEAGASDFPYRWIEVADGVYAALQPEGNRFNDSNSVVIVSANDVVVIDTQNYPQSNEALIARIRETTDKPVRYVIDTHWHGDHTQGNAVYKQAFPEALVIGHPTLAEDIPERAAPQLEEQMDAYRAAVPAAEARLAKGVSRSGEPLDEEGRATLGAQIDKARALLAQMEAVELVTPDLNVDRRLLLENERHEIDIRHYRGHTRGDLVVFLPRQKILVTGDLLDDLPYGGHGFPKEWAAALAELEELDFEILVPGHGRIRQGKSHLVTVREMFEAIVRGAEKARADGTGLDELQASLDLDRYRRTLAGDDPIANRAFDQFVPPTIERAWLEARGELPD